MPKPFPRNFTDEERRFIRRWRLRAIIFYAACTVALVLLSHVTKQTHEAKNIFEAARAERAQTD